MTGSAPRMKIADSCGDHFGRAGVVNILLLLLDLASCCLQLDSMVLTVNLKIKFLSILLNAPVAALPGLSNS